uniref:Immunoglobulin domain-containing protein n=1 Tax=Cyprinus carpio TaxID=7962 RepID=A0A8C1UGA6_CYPCA
DSKLIPVLFQLFGVDSVKSVSVTERESVSLNSDLTEIQRDDEITWKFNNIMIAKISGKDNTSRLYYDNADRRFRDRLKLDQTGSLIITNTRTTHSGEYKVTGRRSETPLNIFSLTVYDELNSVMEGDSVTLNPDLSQIQGFIEILWRFGEKGSTIAQTDGNETSYEDVKRFKGRLQLDNQTGSLTITNVRTNHSGLYKAEINHKTGTSYQKFNVLKFFVVLLNFTKLIFIICDWAPGDHMTAIQHKQHDVECDTA